MRLSLLSFLAALLPISFASAQHFEPGQLVRANGDTVRGEIENSFWNAPPTFIRFRPNAQSPERRFQPHQLRSVQLSSGRYFRYEGLPIDHAAETRTTYLKEGNLTSIGIDSLLADVLLEGPATLLRVVQPGATHFLLQRTGLPVLDLRERQYLRQLPNQSLAVTDGNDYRSQLELFFGDCPVALKLLPATAFTAKALVAVAQAYNETCAPARQPGRSWLPPAGPRQRVAFQAGVLAGVSFNRLTYEDGTCVDCGAHPFAGLYAELLMPNRVAAIYGELTASSVRGLAAPAPYAYGGSNSLTQFNSAIGTATIGARFFIPLARQQKLLLSLSYALNAVFSLPDVHYNYSPQSSLDQRPGYASAGFPGFGVGWRNGPLTLMLSEQVYTAGGNYHADGLFGTGVNTRLGVAYRLGHRADAPWPGK